MVEKTIEQVNSIFEQPWWLDAVAPDQWKAIEIEKGGHLMARMVYYCRPANLGMTFCELPPYTRTLGPWISEHDASAQYSKVLSRETELTKELVAQLPDVDFFDQCFDYSVTNWLPFLWDQYDVNVSYTFVYDDISDQERIWGKLQPRIRNNIRKAENRLEVKYDLPLEELDLILKQTYEIRESVEFYTLESLQKLEKACKEHNSSKAIYAVDKDNNVRAAAYLVFDSHSAYFLLGGVNREFNDTHANSFVIWEAIKYASSVSRKFNFNGNINPHVFKYFTKFGAELKPFFQVTKRSRKKKVCDFVYRNLKYRFKLIR